MRRMTDRPDRYAFLLLAALGVMSTIAGFCFGLWPGVIAFAFAMAVLVIMVLWSRCRQDAIEELTQYLNRILHGDYTLDGLGNEEGELKILKSELYKMTIRLREQADALQQDKVYLADAIADISHQLRTPLTSMGVALSLLSREDCSPQRQRELVREVTVLLHRMDSLITALLKLSKLDTGTVALQAETVLLSSVVRQSAQLVAIPMELRGQRLQVTGDPKAAFQGDLLWTVEALGNILKNCVEHMDEGGVISLNMAENALYTQLVVEDDGKGIAPEDLPHIFERFYRGKNDDSGSFGIGLALSRMIVNRQNGTIKAENRRQGGARFTIRFYKGTI